MKIGDTVRFLHETGGGVVVAFKGNQALVEDADGFQIPMLKNELVVVSGDDKLQKDDSSVVGNTPKEKAKSNLVSTEKHSAGSRLSSSPLKRTISAFLAFVPQDRNNFFGTAFDMVFVNDSDYFLHLSIATAEGNKWQQLADEHVEPNTQIFLDEIDKENLNDYSHLSIQGIYYKQDVPYEMKQPLNVSLRIDGTKFYKLHTFKENPFFETPALVYTLIDDDQPMLNASHVASMTDKKNTAIQSKPATESSVKGNDYVTRYPRRSDKHPFINKKHDDAIVIDLHATALLDQTTGMSPTEILQYQMDKFRSVLTELASKKGQKVVFIHGKGNGVLRQTIIKELSYRYKSYAYQDASFLEYGYGATQVTIK